jgi:hypothetical protein
MAVRRPRRPRRPGTSSSKQSNPPSDNPLPLKRPRHGGPSSSSTLSAPPSDNPPPLTPTDSRLTTIICEPWMVRMRQAPRALHVSAPAPLLVLPGQQRFTQHTQASSRRSVAQDGESNSYSAIGADSSDIVPSDIDPFIDNEPLFSDSLYMPNRPIDPPRPRLSGLQKKQNQWRRWSQEVLPSLVTPYLAYIRQSDSLRSAPDLHCSTRDESHCISICRPRPLAVTCVLFDHEFCLL